MDNLPEYCKFYKQLLVEDIVLNQDTPLKIHHGLCAIIGRISTAENNKNRYYLDNLKLPSIDPIYQISTGTVKLRLDNTGYRKLLPVDRTAEVYGKIIFCNKYEDNQMEVKYPKLSIDMIIERLKMYKSPKKSSSTNDNNDSINPFSPNTQYSFVSQPIESLASIQQYVQEHIEMLQKHYEPALLIHSHTIIDRANELIELNLGLKLVREMRKKKQNL